MRQSSITADDRKWVNRYFRWMVATYGPPVPADTPVLYTEQFLPESLAGTDPDVDSAISDLCHLLDIRRDLVSSEVVAVFDGRDITGTYGVLESELKIEQTEHGLHYTVRIASSIQHDLPRLIYNIGLRLIKLRLNWIVNEVNQEDLEEFLFVAAIYYGLGLVIANHLFGPSAPGGAIRLERIHAAIAYALAEYAVAMGNNEENWLAHLEPAMREDVRLSLATMRAGGNELE